MLTSYPEALVLRDSRRVAISPITPAAKPLIAAATATLSERTSRQRFFSVRYRFDHDRRPMLREHREHDVVVGEHDRAETRAPRP